MQYLGGYTPVAGGQAALRAAVVRQQRGPHMRLEQRVQPLELPAPRAHPEALLQQRPQRLHAARPHQLPCASTQQHASQLRSASHPPPGVMLRSYIATMDLSDT